MWPVILRAQNVQDPQQINVQLVMELLHYNQTGNVRAPRGNIRAQGILVWLVILHVPPAPDLPRQIAYRVLAEEV